MKEMTEDNGFEDGEKMKSILMMKLITRVDTDNMGVCLVILVLWFIIEFPLTGLAHSI